MSLLGLSMPLQGLASIALAVPTPAYEQRVFYQRYAATNPTCPSDSTSHRYGCLGTGNSYSTSTFYSARSDGTDEQPINLTCTGAVPHWMAPFDGTEKIVVDTAKSKLYWENDGEPGIVRSNFDGSDCELVGNGEYYGYKSIAVDSTGDYLYSLRYNQIRRLNIASGLLEYLSFTGLPFTPNNNLSDLTIAGNTLYATLHDQGSSGYIIAVTLNTASTVQAAVVLVTQAVGMRGISVDGTNGYVYWATGSAVKRAALSDGSAVQTIKSGTYNYVVALPTENRLLIGSRGNQAASYTSLTGTGLTATTLRPYSLPTAGAIEVVPVAQTVTWAPTTTLHLSPASPTPATTSGDGAITYAVQSAGSTGCTVDATTAELQFTADGSCTVRATAAATVGFTTAMADVTFTIAFPVAQTVTWTPPTSLTASPVSLPLATTSGNGAITYTVESAGTTGCTVDATTAQLQFTADGSCTVRATAAATGYFTTATTEVTFTITMPVSTPPTTTPTPTSEPAPVGALGISISLAEGAPVARSEVAVSGSGLLPFSTVTIELHSTPIVLGTAQVDASGTFVATVHLPGDIPAGEHHLVVAGVTAAGAPISAQQLLLVDWAGALVGTAERDGYHSLTPFRALDTRETAALAAGDTVELRIGAEAGVPADATAVVANFTATEQHGSGFLSVYPCDGVRPLASMLNFTAGRTVANMTISALGDDRSICVYSSAATHIVVDIGGYYAPSGDDFTAQVARRIVDTRTSSRVTAGQTVEVPIGATTASAAAINLVAVDPHTAGFFTVFPCGTAVPLTSTANFSAGHAVSAQAFAPVVDGAVCVYSSAATDLVVDVSGFFTPDDASSFVRMSPGRLVDTRRRGALVPHTEYVLDLGMLPANADVVALNVTVTDPLGAGYLTVYPCGSAAPVTSNVNFAPGATVANHVTASLGPDGTVCVTASQQLDLVVDVTGMYTSS